MYRHHPFGHRPWEDRREIETAEDRQTAGLVGIVVILLLLICSLFLVQQLRRRADLENCLLSGRTDCALLVPATP